MERKESSFEFETLIREDGSIALPRTVVESFRREGGGRVHVRLTERAIDAALKRRSVGEEEIETIGALQFEARGQVVKFLLSEGSLRDQRKRFHRMTRAQDPVR